MFWIAFEGIDGSGKSTVLSEIERIISSKAKKCGGTGSIKVYYFDSFCIVFAKEHDKRREIGALIDKMVREKINNYILACLFTADRISLKEEIKNLKEKNIYVIADRSCISTLAYQGLDIDMKFLFEMQKKLGAPIPNVIFYLDVDPEEAYNRIKNKTDKAKFEILDLLKRIKENYEKAFEIAGVKVERINANKPLEEVIEDIKKKLEKYLPLDLFG